MADGRSRIAEFIRPAARSRPSNLGIIRVLRVAASQLARWARMPAAKGGSQTQPDWQAHVGYPRIVVKLRPNTTHASSALGAAETPFAQR